jgi:hypothetical protein
MEPLLLLAELPLLLWRPPLLAPGVQPQLGCWQVSPLQRAPPLWVTLLRLRRCCCGSTAPSAAVHNNIFSGARRFDRMRVVVGNARYLSVQFAQKTYLGPCYQHQLHTHRTSNKTPAGATSSCHCLTVLWVSATLCSTTKRCRCSCPAATPLSSDPTRWLVCWCPLNTCPEKATEVRWGSCSRAPASSCRSR